MAVNFVFLLFLSVGIGGFLPELTRQKGAAPGLRVLAGFAILTCGLYVGIVLFRWGVEGTLYGLILAAVAGGALQLRTFLAAVRSPEIFYHPVLILPVAIVAVCVVHGPISFTAYGDDTFINWLAPAKQMWLVDDFHDERFITAVAGYLPGWHFLLAFTSPLWGSFSESRAIAVPAALHVVVLAAAYDVIIVYLKTLNLDPLRKRMIAYGILLLLLAAEASWQLVPTLVLSEMPLFYTLIGLILVGSLFLFEEFRPLPVALFLGVLLCTHYLIKTQGIAAVPVAAGMAFLGPLVFPHSGSRSLIRSVLMTGVVLVPTLLAFVSWKSLGPETLSCASNMRSVIGYGFGQFGPASIWQQLASDLFDAIAVYMASYKVVLSITALIGLTVALFDQKLRWVCLAIVAYILIYLFAVYWSYLSCGFGFNSYLSSLPRYLQLPVRLLHFVGPLLLAVCMIKTLPIVWSGLSGRIYLPVLFIAVGILGGYQIRAIDRSLTTLRFPDMGYMEDYSLRVSKETRAIQTIAKARGLKMPKVSMMYVYYEQLPRLMGIYHGLYGSPAEIREGEPLSPWQLSHLRYSTPEARLPVKSTELTPGYFEDIDIVWPLDKGLGISAEVLALSGDESCAQNPQNYFLIRSDETEPHFQCVLKADHTVSKGSFWNR
ncbi:hypothetical protein [Gimesia sp.]|uniref:hypothetical protein n=1 Tax=Gimesia sp. TaxID=2024833 RepID=UPI003A8D02EE